MTILYLFLLSAAIVHACTNKSPKLARIYVKTNSINNLNK